MTTGATFWRGGTVPTGLDTDALEGWLRTQGMTDAVAVYDGPSIPSDPGALLVVTWLAGAGFSFEDALDTPGFQVRTIGPQGDEETARRLARTVDRAVLQLRGVSVGGRWVVEVRRAGGTPSIDRVDDADRAHYVCTYLADVESDQPQAGGAP